MAISITQYTVKAETAQQHIATIKKMVEDIRNTDRLSQVIAFVHEDGRTFFLLSTIEEGAVPEKVRELDSVLKFSQEMRESDKSAPLRRGKLTPVAATHEVFRVFAAYKRKSKKHTAR